MFGSAVDTKRVYVAINNANHTTYPLGPSNTTTWNAGSWAALDTTTGNFVWQIPATGKSPSFPKYGAGAEGQMSTANGVVYAGSMSGDMVAIDAATGNILWKYASGGSVVCGPSIVDGVVYWGSGYTHFKSGSGSNKLYAFSIPR
jgi:polyvinyl alcohol dehydrogenase (cytochrome)